MNILLLSGLLISLSHALIPSHWLPVIAIGRKEGWSKGRMLGVTALAGAAHVLSTLVVAALAAWLGSTLTERAGTYVHWFGPTLLMALGVFYIYQHYYHHHFHLHRTQGTLGLVASLALAMFLSPCLEVVGLFVEAGRLGQSVVLLLALTYAIFTLLGMLVWVSLALRGLQRLDWHAWEHNAGLVTGVVLILTGVAMFFVG